MDSEPWRPASSLLSQVRTPSPLQWRFRRLTNRGTEQRRDLEQSKQTLKGNSWEGDQVAFAW